MKTTKEYYNLGVKHFNKANLDKAIANLDIAISHDLKNAEALNLRGMIFYIKGQGEKAVHSWKINIDFNDDDTAKKYIKAYKEDKVNEEAYRKALAMIKAVKMKEAIEFLEACTTSDFNIINVRNALSYCYAKEREFEKARDNALMVLDKDGNNTLAKENLEVCDKALGVVHFPIGKKQILAVVALVIVIVGGFFAANTSKKVKPDPSVSSGSIINDADKGENDEVNKIIDESKDINEKTEEDDAITFDGNELSIAMRSNNYDDMHKILILANGDKLSASEKITYDDAMLMMEKEGLKYFYEEGTELVKNESFGEAKDMLLKAYTYAENSYLEEHTNYLLAMCYESLEEGDNSIKYYKEYIDKDYEGDEGSYMDISLYKLALLNEKNNIEESKKYANRLVDEYNDSIYNNTNISRILGN